MKNIFKIFLMVCILIQCSCSFIVFHKKITCYPNIDLKNVSVENTINDIKRSDVCLKCSMPLF